MLSRGYIVLSGSIVAAQYLETYKAFPPSQRAATFTIDQAMEKLKQGMGH